MFIDFNNFAPYNFSKINFLGKVINLHRVTYLIYHMGFEPQVTKMINNVRHDRQTVLFSATFPKTMEALAKKVLDGPVEFVVGRSVVCKNVGQHALVVEEHQKYLKLIELLVQYWQHGNVLVFVKKQETKMDLENVMKFDDVNFDIFFKYPNLIGTYLVPPPSQVFRKLCKNGQSEQQL
ncbi:unnamed protein product [Meloidogyne enterolobii]|uniref:Uncharacterized protein n=1 Tax=Meloidogyne enterolobii TaxID=390850 RepID=A0ACB1AZB4_MELEN